MCEYIPYQYMYLMADHMLQTVHMHWIQKCMLWHALMLMMLQSPAPGSWHHPTSSRSSSGGSTCSGIGPLPLVPTPRHRIGAQTTLLPSFTDLEGHIQHNTISPIPWQTTAMDANECHGICLSHPACGTRFRHECSGRYLDTRKLSRTPKGEG